MIKTTITARTGSEVMAAVIENMLIHLEVMKTQQIIDNLFGAQEEFIQFTYNGWNKKTPAREKKLKDYLTYVIENATRPDMDATDEQIDDRLRAALISFCWDQKLNKDGMGSVLR